MFIRETVLITSRSHIDIIGKEVVKDNIIAVDWHTPLSFNPFFYGIAIGKTRHSIKLIQKSRVFAVNFMPFSLKEKIVFCGTQSGEHIDKFKETGLTKIEATKIDCPLIKEALDYLECEVVNEVDIGDHTFFVGKVLNTNFKGLKGKREKRLVHSGEKFVGI